jgi:hypothetical protein
MDCKLYTYEKSSTSGLGGMDLGLDDISMFASDEFSLFVPMAPVRLL